jgi:N-ethylmaleimide reductase
MKELSMSLEKTESTRRDSEAVPADRDVLFSPYRLHQLQLNNRLVMAPMTRSRAVEGNVPHPNAARYYSQRASAGLIVAEGAQVSPQGVGYIRTPGIHSPEQVAGWKKVTAAVHAAGGKIFLQLWHVGRASHPDFHNGELPVAPSAIAAMGEVFTHEGPKKMVQPRALATSEIPGIVEQFAAAAKNAKEAQFDGVEIHGANGYLLDQFTRDGTNVRTDAYGGNVRNRIRLPIEVAEAVASVWGVERVGYRISPNNPFGSMSDTNPRETFGQLTEELSRLRMGYLHVVDPYQDGAKRISPLLRARFDGTYIVNGGFDAAAAEAVLSAGEADLVAFGVPFLANPDLPERYQRGAKLNSADTATFYTGDDKGYADYPALH